MKKKKNALPKILDLKKISVTGIIALLLLTLSKITEPSFATSSTPSLPGSSDPVQLYSNQTHDDLTQLYANAIKGAKRSVVLVIYSLKDAKVLEALKHKIDAKVPVFVVCDAQASPGIQRKIPGAHLVRRAHKGLTHQKILVIDDTDILLGSANLTSESLRVHGNLVVGINNPALAKALADKIKSMDEEGQSDPLARIETSADTQHLELGMLPDDATAPQRLIQLFRSAKKTINVAMFTWTRRDFAQELINAAQRGVKVSVVLDRYSGKGASAHIVKMFQRAGIPVKLSTGQGLLHHKFAYIDGSVLINGSANWTNNAFKSNDDCFLVIYPLEPQQQQKMDRLWQTILSESKNPS